MERKIGEIFKYNDEWYQCVIGCHCSDCAFNNDNCEERERITLKEKLTKEEITGLCASELRNDKTSVIFKKLEKVGEPFERNGYMYQEYKAHTYPLLMSGGAKIPTDNGFAVIINKEDMEEKKDNYDGNMDKECIQICDALNSISDVHTTESCCGHCKDRFMVFFTCDNPHSLAIIARVFDRRYISTSQPWYIELQTKDSGAYDYFIHSETKYDSEIAMMKDVNQIIENIKHWCDDKFASHFKGCDDKPTLAPFDINLAKQGKPVCTRGGRKARVICFDRKHCHQGHDYPIVALISEGCYDEFLCSYTKDGLFAPGECYNTDLMMLPEKKEGWVNIYKSLAYSTKEGAIKYRNKGNDYIDTIKISWEE